MAFRPQKRKFGDDLANTPKVFHPPSGSEEAKAIAAKAAKERSQKKQKRSAGSSGPGLCSGRLENTPRQLNKRLNLTWTGKWRLRRTDTGGWPPW